MRAQPVSVRPAVEAPAEDARFEEIAGPLVAAAARASRLALLDLLACSAVFSVEDERADQIPEQFACARQDLAAALTELDELPATLAALFPDGFAH
ncbi:hypothetical protein ACFV7Q_23695 [Streptomyces sp. NPDC059851]|uniref:hypothetical protein n=1 Tax=Streptomyces sp. NPDC059851 TaxID=3346971 RepID=UPI00365459FD